MQGWGLGESVEEHFIGVGMIEGVIEIALADLGERPGTAQSGEEFDAGLGAQSAENIVAVVVTLIEGRGSGAGRLGDAAHGEGFFAASGPEPAGGVKDALFEFRICLSGQRPASVLPGSLQGPTALTMSN
jgi:hypothetical protein